MPFTVISCVPPTNSFQCSLCLSVYLSSSRFQPASHRGSGRRPGALNVRQLFVGGIVVEAKVQCLKTVGLIRVWSAHGVKSIGMASPAIKQGFKVAKGASDEQLCCSIRVKLVTEEFISQFIVFVGQTSKRRQQRIWYIYIGLHWKKNVSVP